MHMLASKEDTIDQSLSIFKASAVCSVWHKVLWVSSEKEFIMQLDLLKMMQVAKLQGDSWTKKNIPHIQNSILSLF